MPGDLGQADLVNAYLGDQVERHLEYPVAAAAALRRMAARRADGGSPRVRSSRQLAPGLSCEWCLSVNGPEYSDASRPGRGGQMAFSAARSWCSGAPGPGRDRPCVQGKRSQKGSWSITLEFCSTTASTRPGFLPRGERCRRVRCRTRSPPGRAARPAPQWRAARLRFPGGQGRRSCPWGDPACQDSGGEPTTMDHPKALNTSLERGRPCRTHSSGEHPTRSPARTRSSPSWSCWRCPPDCAPGSAWALQAAMCSRSMPEIWEMIRLSNDLTELGGRRQPGSGAVLRTINAGRLAGLGGDQPLAVLASEHG